MIKLIKEVIAQTLNHVLEDSKLNMETAFRTPLIGYSNAHSPLYEKLKAAVSPDHALPSDLLPEAETVVAFFLPFTRELVQENRQGSYAARSWAIAYIEANSLINRCCQEISQALSGLGVKSAWQQPTHNFDPEKLCAKWSHKHVAYICGLGNFGLHHMLITPSGCAGRFGSIVIDKPLSPSPRPAEPLCRYFLNGTCLVCVNKCPSGALSREGLNNKKCYAYLLETDALFADLGLCDVCGKCAVWGPCASLPASLP